MAARRVVQANQVILDQVDFYQSDGTTRIIGIVPDSLISQVFYNNRIQVWPLVSGIAIPDAQVTAGRVYFNEIPGEPGFYSVRFRPNALGYWRNLLAYPDGSKQSAQDFDVVADSAGFLGLQASFIKPGGGCC